MKRLAGGALLLAFASGCPTTTTTELPDASSCSARVTLNAWAGPAVDAPGGVTVYGSATAPNGVTVRAVVVAGIRVKQGADDFNFQSWKVDVPADRLQVFTRDGEATLPVVAFTSDGCAEPTTAVTVSLSDAGIPEDDGGGIRDADDGDDAPADDGGVQ
jgi:hypothetical protein